MEAFKIENYVLNDFKSNICNIENKKMKVDKIIQNQNSVVIDQKDLNIKNDDELYVIIKNIKTRDEYLCEHLISKNKIIIILEPLIHLFTNYEGSIYILYKNNGDFYAYTPFLKNHYAIDQHQDSKKLYRWFTRVLENDEIRFSCIIKTSL